ncbi:MAG: 3-hydroxybutyrate dehydrogenase [Planctomycetaceae bacterium]
MNHFTFDTNARSAVVTGSNSGIGLAIARRLAASGIKVALNSFTDRSEDHELASKIAQETGSKVIYLQADLSDPDQCSGLIQKTKDAFDSVDILVNNAGVQHVEPIESFDPAWWDRVVAIDLSAAFHTTKAVLPLMKTAGWGRIVNTASVHALKASPFKIAYVSSKHGILGMTRATAVELGKSPITCNAICPGIVKTEMILGQMDDQVKATGLSKEAVMNELFERVPSKDFVLPEQLAAAVAFLCSNAAAQITGIALPVDGGISAY